jgi:hypothetical protein
MLIGSNQFDKIQATAFMTGGLFRVPQAVDLSDGLGKDERQNG